MRIAALWRETAANSVSMRIDHIATHSQRMARATVRAWLFTLGLLAAGLLIGMAVMLSAPPPVHADDSCTTGDEATLTLPPLEPGQVRAITKDGAWVIVNPLNHPDNPYREMYGAWDKWVYDHFDATLGFADLPAG